MFEKLVAIEPVSLIPSAEEELHRYAKEVVLYRDVPGSDAEMVRRIGDADAVLLSYTSRMGKEVIAQCPNIRYIGMCCSLYSEESANVDIAYARTRRKVPAKIILQRVIRPRPHLVQIGQKGRIVDGRGAVDNGIIVIQHQAFISHELLPSVLWRRGRTARLPEATAQG